MTNILQILPRLVTGGVERGTVEVAEAITKAGWKAIVASEGGPMVAEVEHAGGTHITLPLASKNPLTIRSNIARLAEVIETHKADIIHARSRAPAWSAYFAARRTHRPFVTTFHNTYGGTTGLKKLYNSVMAKGDRVIAISNFVAAHAQKIYGVPSNILRIIPRGVDIHRFDPTQISDERVAVLRQQWNVPTDKTTLILPGRLTRWKGQEIFIRALAALKRDDIFAIIVGSGDDSYKAELNALIAAEGLTNTIKLVDECRDMPAAFKLADIAISASTRPEGFGRVIVEAQAMGCLTIATNHGGAAESIINNQTGLLVSPNDVHALTNALQNALTLSPTERQNFGERAAMHVRANFTTALMTSRTLDMYRELLQ